MYNENFYEKMNGNAHKKTFQSDALLIHLIYNASKIGFTSLKLYYAQQGAS